MKRFKKYSLLKMCLYCCLLIGGGARACRAQRTTDGSRFSPSTVSPEGYTQVVEVSSTCLYSLSHLPNTDVVRVRACMCAFVLWHVCEGQSTILWNQFSSTFMQVLGIELRLSV